MAFPLLAEVRKVDDRLYDNPERSASEKLELRRGEPDLRKHLGHTAEEMAAVIEWFATDYPDEFAKLSVRQKKCAADVAMVLIEHRGWCHYPRRKAVYSRRRDLYGYRVMFPSVDFLVGIDFGDHIIGELDYETDKGNRSTLKVTEWARERARELGIAPTPAVRFPKSPIELNHRRGDALRDVRSGDPKDYTDTEYTYNASRQVAKLNNAYCAQTLIGADGKAKTIWPGKRKYLDSFDLGGDYYIGLQNAKRTERAQWQWEFNGQLEPNEEPDIVAAHPTMMYAQIGATPPDGVYHIDGVPDALAKLAFNTLVNAASRRQAVGRVAHDIQTVASLRKACLGWTSCDDNPRDLAEQEAQRVVGLTYEKHAPIAHLFGQDMGVFFQKILGDILCETSERVLDETGFAPPPIHDGMLGPASLSDLTAHKIIEVGREHGYEFRVMVKGADGKRAPTTTNYHHRGIFFTDLRFSQKPETPAATPETPIPARAMEEVSAEFSLRSSLKLSLPEPTTPPPSTPDPSLLNRYRQKTSPNRYRQKTSWQDYKQWIATNLPHDPRPPIGQAEKHLAWCRQNEAFLRETGDDYLVWFVIDRQHAKLVLEGMDPANVDDIGAIIAHWKARGEAKEARKAANRSAGAKKAAETRKNNKLLADLRPQTRLNRYRLKRDMLGLPPLSDEDLEREYRAENAEWLVKEEAEAEDKKARRIAAAKKAAETRKKNKAKKQEATEVR